MIKKKNGNFFKPKQAVRPPHLPRIPKSMKHSIEQGLFLLDQMSAEDIDRYLAIENQLREYYYDEYYYFASERAKRIEQLQEALSKKTAKLEFSDHYRCVASAYNDRPLSAKGSRINSIGGRFNFGAIGATFPPFSALYIGEDLPTARAEFRQKDLQNPNKISLEDFHGLSTSDFRTEGQLNCVIDLTDHDSLKPFIKVLRKIEISEDLTRKAILAGLSGIRSIKKLSELQDLLLMPSWRLAVARFGIPSNSQSFGYLVRSAGIEAIRYKSKFASGSCLAIFPENVLEDSYIKLSDSVPANVVNILDKNTVKIIEN